MAADQARATLTASRLEATSCTRTPQAPLAAASAVVAVVAASRSAGAAALPSTGQQRAEETLAAGAHQDAVAQVAEAVQGTQQFPVVFRVLGEAESRIQDQLFGLDAGGGERLAQGDQFLDDLGDDVGVVCLGGHRGGVPAAVHEHVGGAGLGDQRGHVRLVGQARDVVDDVRARGKRGTGGGGVHGVDRDDRAGLGQRGDHRDDAGLLGGGSHRLGAGAG